MNPIVGQISTIEFDLLTRACLSMDNEYIVVRPTNMFFNFPLFNFFVILIIYYLLLVLHNKYLISSCSCFCFYCVVLYCIVILSIFSCIIF